MRLEIRERINKRDWRGVVCRIDVELGDFGVLKLSRKVFLGKEND